MTKKYKSWLRDLRGWFYRGWPIWGPAAHRKRVTGYERRWGLETEGFTKEGFWQVFQHRLLPEVPSGLWMELQAGNGLVGSLGLWLEGQEGWRVEAWEHRFGPASVFQKNRPSSLFHAGRLTAWTPSLAAKDPAGISTRGVREAAGVCRAIRKKMIHPVLIGLWNPSRRGIWERRLHPLGYRLELVWHNLEFYRLSEESGTDAGWQKAEDRWQKTEVGGRCSVVGS